MTSQHTGQRGPTFLGVGPEKTGSSWLFRQLTEHPDVWMPPIKEMRYFWEKAHYPGETFFDRLRIGESWHRRQYRKYAWRRFKEIVRRPYGRANIGLKRLGWDTRYLLTTHDDDWYVGSFDRSACVASGEISPQYFFLERNQIEGVARTLPECKIVVGLREPKDWVMSFLKMHLRNGVVSKDVEAMRKFVVSRAELCSFSTALTHWFECFGRDRVLVCIFDHLQTDPWGEYQRVCEFLGLEPDPAKRSEVKAKVNAGTKEIVPPEVLEEVQDVWNEDVQALKQLTPNIPDEWLGKSPSVTA